MNFRRALFNGPARQCWRKGAPDSYLFIVIELDLKRIDHVTHWHCVIAATHFTGLRQRCKIGVGAPMDLVRLAIPSLGAIAELAARDHMAWKKGILTRLAFEVTEHFLGAHGDIPDSPSRCPANRGRS